MMIVLQSQFNYRTAWRECHVLEISSVPALEFASALDNFVPVMAWRQQMRWFGPFARAAQRGNSLDPPVPIMNFPLQRGYAHPWVSRASDFTDKLLSQLHQHCRQPSECPLICTVPFFAPVAEQWPGPVIYYSLDLTYAYKGLNADQVRQLDQRLCRAAHLVCPISQRIADYFVEQSGCDPGKIQIVPNATRACNIRQSPSSQPDQLPSLITSVKRPIVGVIGNMAENLDWKLLQGVVEKTSDFSWVFVGPVPACLADKAQNEARSAVMNSGNRIHFVGSQPFGTLQAFARSFDVAVLPYAHREPTYSGSATRFYEHLAAGRPILATPHVFELQKKQPLVSLMNEADEFVSKLYELKAAQFQDGYEAQRWLESRKETWEVRAETMLHALWSVTEKRRVPSEIEVQRESLLRLEASTKRREQIVNEGEMITQEL